MNNLFKQNGAIADEDERTSSSHQLAEIGFTDVIKTAIATDGVVANLVTVHFEHGKLGCYAATIRFMAESVDLTRFHG